MDVIKNREIKMTEQSAKLLEIELVEGELRVDSRLVAERLEIEHRSFLETIMEFKTRIEQEFGFLRLETAEIKGRGRPGRFAFLNEDQAIFLVTLSRNTPQVVECKISIVKSFSSTRKLNNPDASAIDRLQAQIALEFEKDKYRPWRKANPEADRKFRELVAIPSEPQILQTLPVEHPSQNSLMELVDTLSLAANRAGLAGNKSIKEAEFLDGQLSKIRSQLLSLEQDNRNLRASQSRHESEVALIKDKAREAIFNGCAEVGREATKLFEKHQRSAQVQIAMLSIIIDSLRKTQKD